MKRVVLLCLALSLALTGCAQGVEIVPIESLSPEKTAANLFSAQPFARPSPRTYRRPLRASTPRA